MKTVGRVWWVAVAVSLVTSGAWAQEAQPKARVSLRADAPDECPDDAQLLHRVEALLGRSSSEGVQQPLGVRVNVQGNPSSGYVATLAFTSAQGTEQRVLEHPSCEKLIEAASLVIALAIDPDAVRATQQAREAPTSPAPAPAAVQPIAAAPKIVERVVFVERKSVEGLRLGVHGALGAGPLPRLGAGLQVALGYQRAAWRAEVLGRYWAPRSEAVGLGSNGSIDLELASVGLRGCWLPLTGDWSVAGCLGADLGDLRGRGLDLDAERVSHARYSSLAAGFRVAYSRWRVAPEGGFELSAALERPSFGVLENGVRQETTFQPAAWGLVAFVGGVFQL